MDSQTEKERQYVYLTYRDLFCGSRARVRNRKVIRSIVLKHWAQSGTIAHEHHLNKIVTVLKTLLGDRVFEFERQARKTFPDLFFKSPPVPHPIMFLSKHDATSEGSTDTKRKRRLKNFERLAPHVSHEFPTVERKHDICTSMELQLIRFPFVAQHHVLSRVQQLLEETCFRFMDRWLPSTLVQHNWTCAAAIELTKSLSIIKTNLYILPGDCMDAAEQTLFIEIAPDVAQLRHAAVHRVHLEHDKFLQQINCARKLAEILQHSENLNILQTLYNQVDALIKKLEYDTKVVKQKADCILLQLSQQREVLMQREQQLRDAVAQKQIELAAAAGRAILEPIEALSFTGGPKNMNGRDGVQETIDLVVAVDENDIDSDEDQLQAELG